MRFLTPRNRAILGEMVRTDFKLRYQGSVLGYAWSLLKPLLMFAIIYFVFTVLIPLGKGVEHYPVYLLLGIILWTFFVEATSVGAGSIVARGDLIRKINIPRYLIVISSSVSALINLGLSLVVIFLFALFNGVTPSWDWVLLVPLIIELFLLSMSIAFFLSALYVKFRDITYIWEIMIQAGFYASAIIFPLVSVPEHLQKWFFINPIVQIIQDARYLIATDTSPVIWTHPNFIAIPFIIIVIIAVGGGLYFKRRSKYFAEEI